MLTHYWKTIDGWFKFKAAYDTILAALPASSPSTFVELGVWYGRSTAYLGVEIINRQKPVTLIAVDHFKGQPEIEIHARRAAMVSESEAACRRHLQPIADALGDRFRIVVSDSATAAVSMPDGSVDAVWLDAAHDYEGVRRDMAAWWPKVKVGGFLGGDDYIKCQGVREAVHERFGPRAGMAQTHYWLVRRREGDAVECLA